MANPFRAGLSRRVEPCTVIIFGVTGDLAHRKLVPALYNLGVDGLLPANFSLVGFARREMTDEQLRRDLTRTVEEHSRRRPLDAAVWKEFADHSYYVSGSFDDIAAYRRLGERLNELESASGGSVNRIFYFATAPEYFEVIARNLRAAGLVADTMPSDGTSQTRLVIEKPFGHDVGSARELNRALSQCVREDQIYRIDHYLGKETVQNLLVFRFANGTFEPIWNHKYIDHVQISVCESIGVENRAGYFDRAGILRDIVQNHLLQLLCLVALEPPVAFEADAVRDEKVKVLRSIRPFSREDVARKVVRARYIAGSVGGATVPGYLAEPGVDPESTTETYVAIEFAIDNWRWAGVPFLVRAGKRLPKRVTEISIHFRTVPYSLFRNEEVRRIPPNVLAFQIQPDEGITLRASAKPPGPKVQLQTVSMNFSYGSSFGAEPPEAYERLLLDCMKGDATLFTRSDEIETAWEILSPILGQWSDPRKAPPVYSYEAGTWGPQAADEMIVARVSEPWRRL